MLRLILSVAALSVTLCATAHAQLVITQAKALRGSVTPNDAPGFPVTLSLPGHYMLASNLASDTDGIEVRAKDVTIDLNGFMISGGASYGIDASIAGYADRLTVKNGTIAGFRRGAIEFGSGNQDLLVDHMRIINTFHSIVARDASFVRVHGSMVVNSDYQGIVCGTDCLVERSIISQSYHGIGVIITSGEVLDNTISDNAAGIRTGRSWDYVVGAGNNSVFNNSSYQMLGRIAKLSPNVCSSGVHYNEPCPK